jgi:hypothetical protein
MRSPRLTPPLLFSFYFCGSIYCSSHDSVHGTASNRSLLDVAVDHDGHSHSTGAGAILAGAGEHAKLSMRTRIMAAVMMEFGVTVRNCMAMKEGNKGVTAEVTGRSR